MFIKHENKYKSGYNEVVSNLYKNDSFRFGIIHLENKEEYKNKVFKERAFLLIYGTVVIEYLDKIIKVSRESFLNENPICLHVPRSVNIKITATCESELSYQEVGNDNHFEVKLYHQSDCIVEEFGKDILNGTAQRIVRTVFDDSIAPHSNFVIGEVINFPGKWSSYPPHYHIQREIYHYRIYPEQGFGICCEGEKAYKIRNKDTMVIESEVVHPQVSAPGYAMYYIWVIQHQPKRWKKDRIYLKEDNWLFKENSIIWSNKKGKQNINTINNSITKRENMGNNEI